MGVLTMLEAAIGAVVTIVVYLFVCLKAYGGAFGVGAVTQYVGAVTSLFLGFSALLNQLGPAPCEYEIPGRQSSGGGGQKWQRVNHVY